jgi:AcrR family transcriptional regulator
MHTPLSRKEQTHERILDVAAGVMRAHGFDGVGVADIMKRAGLTHGGFYAHFASRDALLAEALERAGHDSRGRLQRAIDQAGDAPGERFRALVENYLSERHLKSPDSGCPVAALASEMPRQSEAVRTVAARRVAGLTDAVAAALGPSRDRDDAAIVSSQLIGALQTARLLGDNAQGRRHLAASRAFLLERFGAH